MRKLTPEADLPGAHQGGHRPGQHDKQPSAKEDRDAKHKKVVIAMVELNVMIERVRQEQADFAREVRERAAEMREFITSQFAALKKTL